MKSCGKRPSTSWAGLARARIRLEPRGGVGPRSGTGTRLVGALSMGLVITFGCVKDQDPDRMGGQATPSSSPLPDADAGIDAEAAAAASPSPVSPFNASTFEKVIQPILDAAEGKGCSAAACHGSAMGIAGFKLSAHPASGSAELKDDFASVTALCDLKAPDASRLLDRATTRHAGGGSAVVTADEGKTILAWIQEAKASSAGAVTPSSCAPLTSFNQAVFKAAILPILTGDVDLNNAGGGGSTAGCARSTCHGSDPAKPFSIKKTNTAQQNLESLACYVNLKDPALSDVITCPLNLPSCKHYPHPGQAVFGGASDANYQRVLSFLYASKTASTPLDFAFFVRKVQPLFNDVTLGGAPQRTCSSTSSCHGVNAVTQAPANASNFPILANAKDKSGFAFNFWAAANFLDVVDATESDLFLFPTNEIANKAAHKLATGLPHPGGTDFAATSAPAEAILQWARGLHADAAGFQPNWLVAGDYAAQRVSESTPLGNEAQITPTLLDASNATQFNDGKWDAFFAPGTVIDLNVPFPRPSTTGRVAYAVSYLMNRTTSDIQARISVTSQNPVLLYVGPAGSAAEGNGSGAVAAEVTLPAFSQSQKVTRLMVKVLQRAADTSFGFSVQLTDTNGSPLTQEAGGDVLVKLGPEGGI